MMCKYSYGNVDDRGLPGVCFESLCDSKVDPAAGSHQHYRETPLDLKYARDNVGSITTSVIGHNLHKDER